MSEHWWFGICAGAVVAAGARRRPAAGSSRYSSRSSEAVRSIRESAEQRSRRVRGHD